MKMRSILALVFATLTTAAAAQDPPPPTPTPAAPAEAQAPPADKKPVEAQSSPAGAKPQAAADAEEEEADETAAWIGTRYLQTATPLVNELGLFEANFNHRFYDSWINAGGSRLYGLDNGASIYLAMDYVPIKNVAIQIARATLFADYEFALKATLLRPTKELPIGIGLRGGINWLTANYFQRQSSGFAQLLLSGTFGDRFTIGASPSYTQRTPTRKGVINVPIAVSYRLTKSTTLTGELVPQYGPSELKAQWSVGIGKELYHHKFALWIGNSGATTVDQMLASDYNGGVRDYNFRLGFNVVRQWDLIRRQN
jgi:hypothetical protein